MENWKPIEEFKGSYEVSDLGRVRSVERRINNRTLLSKIKKPHVYKDNCQKVWLQKNKSTVERSVGNLVAEAFIGPCPPGSRYVRHLDGDPLNNAATNLEWNVRKAFYLPENPVARKLFFENAERIVNIFAHKETGGFNYGIIDTDDFMQEALFRIWKNIDSYDEKIKFQTFCYTHCSYVYKDMYRKYCPKAKREVYIAELHNSDEDYAPEDWRPELAYYDKYFGEGENVHRS